MTAPDQRQTSHFFPCTAEPVHTCAPRGGHRDRIGLTIFVAGETLHGLSKRHDISRQLIRIWVGKYEAGALDDDVQAADLPQLPFYRATR